MKRCCLEIEIEKELGVFLVNMPEHHLTFYLIFVQLQFSAVLSFFFRQGVRIEPHVTFWVVFCPAKPKIKPHNQPLEHHIDTLNTLNT